MGFIFGREKTIAGQYEASRDTNPAPKLENITALLLAINPADDERNPPELMIMEREIKKSSAAGTF